MNLVTNAREAVGDVGGAIALRTGWLRADAAYLADAYGAADPTAGDFVFVEVSDSGPGIDEPNRKRVFEPFFSTKFSGRGLGLAAVHGIVHAHGGWIKLSSDPGRDTTFRVLLPRSARAPEQRPSPEAPDGLPATSEGAGRATVLVVDDDEAVLELTQEFLERANFSVIAAEGGEKALRIFRQRASEIDVVVLDLSMPDVDGEQTFQEIRRQCPDASVILVSGYSEEMAAERFAAAVGAEGFLSKPYPPEELVERIQRALAR
jgi:CheY-like chemotaxis protein